jgi:hypothetical protein
MWSSVFSVRVDDCAVVYLKRRSAHEHGRQCPTDVSDLRRGAVGAGTEGLNDEIFSITPANLLTGDNVSP